MSALQRLNLRENELESAGAVALAPVLSSLRALQVRALYMSMQTAHISTATKPSVSLLAKLLCTLLTRHGCVFGQSSGEPVVCP